KPPAEQVKHAGLSDGITLSISGEPIPRAVEPGATNFLHVTNLPWWATEDDLRRIVEIGVGETMIVKDVAFSENQATGKSEGKAVVELFDPETASAARKALSAASFGDSAKCSVVFFNNNPYRLALRGVLLPASAPTPMAAFGRATVPIHPPPHPHHPHHPHHPPIHPFINNVPAAHAMPFAPQPPMVPHLQHPMRPPMPPQMMRPGMPLPPHPHMMRPGFMPHGVSMAVPPPPPPPPAMAGVKRPFDETTSTA
ncbi:hypothetical protein GQ42DRAFT_18676, partial [Ramicandelaber brevisporus]